MNRRECRPLSPLCRWLMAGALVMAALPVYPGEADRQPEIGRLFFEPAERQALDDGRDAEPRPDGEQARGQSAVRQVVLNGFIRRSGDQPVVWLNGVAQDGRQQGIKQIHWRTIPDKQNRIVVEADRSGAVARLKPGQAWNLGSGALSDCVRCTAASTAMPDTPADTPAPTTAVVERQKAP